MSNELDAIGIEIVDEHDLLSDDEHFEIAASGIHHRAICADCLNFIQDYVAIRVIDRDWMREGGTETYCRECQVKRASLADKMAAEMAKRKSYGTLSVDISFELKCGTCDGTGKVKGWSQKERFCPSCMGMGHTKFKFNPSSIFGKMGLNVEIDDIFNVVHDLVMDTADLMDGRRREDAEALPF